MRMLSRYVAAVRIALLLAAGADLVDYWLTVRRLLLLYRSQAWADSAGGGRC